MCGRAKADAQRRGGKSEYAENAGGAERLRPYYFFNFITRGKKCAAFPECGERARSIALPFPIWRESAQHCAALP